MRESRYITLKYSFQLFVLGVYFFAFFRILVAWNDQGWLASTTGNRNMIFLAVLYVVAIELMVIRFEGLQIGRRRILDLLFGFFFGTLSVNVAALAIEAAFFAVPMKGLICVHLLLLFGEWIISFVWIYICQRLFEKVQFNKEAVYIYGERETEYDINRAHETINRFYKINKMVGFQEIQDAISDFIKDNVVVFLGDIPVQHRNRIIKYCMSNRIECFGMPKVSDIYIQSSDIMQLHDKMLFRYPDLEIKRRSMAIKRGMDIVLSLIMIIVASPIMLVIAICIKIEDHGPIIYRQDRVTIDGKPFQMLKFRSMRVDAEADGPQMTRKNDSRVTRIGQIIRNIHFDELLQLVNVLKGDMSLVGPRPERMEFIEEYSEIIPEFKERLKVRGGLTGFAQVYGRYNTAPEDKIKYDLYYIYNYSLALDIKLLILTVRILFQKENTEGIEENQVNAKR